MIHTAWYSHAWLSCERERMNLLNVTDHTMSFIHVGCIFKTCRNTGKKIPKTNTVLKICMKISCSIFWCFQNKMQLWMCCDREGFLCFLQLRLNRLYNLLVFLKLYNKIELSCLSFLGSVDGISYLMDKHWWCDRCALDLLLYNGDSLWVYLMNVKLLDECSGIKRRIFHSWRKNL